MERVVPGRPSVEERTRLRILTAYKKRAAQAAAKAIVSRNFKVESGEINRRPSIESGLEGSEGGLV